MHYSTKFTIPKQGPRPPSNLPLDSAGRRAYSPRVASRLVGLASFTRGVSVALRVYVHECVCVAVCCKSVSSLQLVVIGVIVAVGCQFALLGRLSHGVLFIVRGYNTIVRIICYQYMFISYHMYGPLS